MNFPNEYEKYSKMSMQDLAEIMGNHEELKSKANIARLVYEERQMAQQHELNRKLIMEQVRWMKFSVIAVLVAAVVGAVVASILSRC